MKFLAFIFGLQIFALSAQADIRMLELYRQKQTSQQKTKLALATEFFTYPQKLDYKNVSDTRTFAQRYFINSTYASQPVESAPVLLLLCGEGACSEGSMINTLSRHAKVLGAHMVAIEHRYYGKSLPFTHLSTENLQYLSTDYALQDAAIIEQAIQQTKNWNGKWISVGGSYAGSLSAYYRQRYPHLVEGALSSSGPVQAKENFEEYDHHVSDVLGKECAATVRLVVSQIEASLDNPVELLRIKKMFQAEVLKDNVDFLYLIADMGATAAQYGYRDMFCEDISGTDPLQGYADFTLFIYRMFGMDALSMSAQGAENPDVDPNASVGMRQWFYQSCMEFGYWQNAYHDAKISVRSAQINPAYHKNICKRLFNLEIAGQEVKSNDTFYKPLLKDETSNILFTNGSEDPWSKLSITALNHNDTNPNTNVFMIANASHCDDLSSAGNNSAVTDAQQLFDKLAKNWLFP